MPPPSLNPHISLNRLRFGLTRRLTNSPGIRFWLNGGDVLVQPLDREDGQKAALALAFQPDGDIVLFVPKCFGRASSDQAVAEAFMARSTPIIHRTVTQGLSIAAQRLSLWLKIAVLASWILPVVFSAYRAEALWHGAIAEFVLPLLLWALLPACATALLPHILPWIFGWLTGRVRRAYGLA